MKLPVKKGGLNWWQKGLFAGGVVVLAVAGCVGVIASRPQQDNPDRTATPKPTPMPGLGWMQLKTERLIYNIKL